MVLTVPVSSMISYNVVNISSGEKVSKQKEVYSLTHSRLLCSGGTDMAAGFSLSEQADWTGKQGGSEEEWIPERHLSK